MGLWSIVLVIYLTGKRTVKSSTLADWLFYLFWLHTS